MTDDLRVETLQIKTDYYFRFCGYDKDEAYFKKNYLKPFVQLGVQQKLSGIIAYANYYQAEDLHI